MCRTHIPLVIAFLAMSYSWGLKIKERSYQTKTNKNKIPPLPEFVFFPEVWGGGREGFWGFFANEKSYLSEKIACQYMEILSYMLSIYAFAMCLCALKSIKTVGICFR